ncbi:MAG: hypothetical protein U9R25_05960 [Chloroflexota bacterium]|nr:hypothetical protein [Chloroflexota bacterium]
MRPVILLGVVVSLLIVGCAAPAPVQEAPQKEAPVVTVFRAPT